MMFLYYLDKALLKAWIVRPSQWSHSRAAILSPEIVKNNSKVSFLIKKKSFVERFGQHPDIQAWSFLEKNIWKLWKD